MDKMGLIVFAETGHVLGAFTRQGDPEGALGAEAVAGEGVWIRDEQTGSRLLTVEAQHLKVEVVDRSDRVLLDWQRYVVEDGVPDEPPGGTVIGLSAANVSVTIPGPPSPQPVEAWVQVEGGPSDERIVRRVTIPVPLVQGTELINFAPGDYVVLALVPGRRAELARITLP